MLEIVIFLITVFLSTRLNPLIDNITGLMNQPSYRWISIVYIIGSACFFGYRMYKLFTDYSMNRGYLIWVVITTVVMSLGALFPYSEGGNTFFSVLHLICCMVGCLSFLILLFIYTRYISVYDTELYLKIHWFYDGAVQFLGLLILFFGRINGYIEMVYAFVVCGYLLLIRYKKIDVFKRVCYD